MFFIGTLMPSPTVLVYARNVNSYIITAAFRHDGSVFIYRNMIV